VLEFSRFVIKMGKGVKKYGTGDVYLGGDQVKLFQIQAVGSGTHEIFLFFFSFYYYYYYYYYYYFMKQSTKLLVV
jgi:hypothetical protein